MWLAKAKEMAQQVVIDESFPRREYDDTQVRLSIVHTREDVVMLVSLLGSVNIHLAWIRIFLMILIGLCAYGLFR